MGIPFQAVEVDFPELTPAEANWLSPGELARYNAVGKAESVQLRHPSETILAADTVVSVGKHILGKPADLEQARLYLRQLSGRVHHVTTALAMAHPENGLASLVTTTKVKFKKLNAAGIEKYLGTVNVLDKAGAYAIQDHGDWLVESIEGSVSNVIGLPVEALADLFIQSALAWINTSRFQ